MEEIRDKAPTRTLAYKPHMYAHIGYVMSLGPCPGFFRLGYLGSILFASSTLFFTQC